MPLRNLVIDFNAYFASCEQHLRPELRGRPVAVTPVLTGTGCCIAASYAAKARGVRTGSRVAEARQLCPGIAIVEARPDLYIDLHHKLVGVVENCTHVARVLSIDEIECVLTGKQCRPDRARRLAQEIKRAIVAATSPSMGSSIGIAPNTLLAKVASKLEKPNGLTLLRDEDLPERLYSLELDDIHGIGDQMAERLHRAGVHSVRQLYAQDERAMYRLWGSVEGERMYHRLRGREVWEKPTSRSVVGHSHVLPPDMRNPQGVHAVLHRLLQKAAARLRRLEHLAGAISLGLRYRDRDPATGESLSSRWDDGLRFQHTQDTLELMRRLEQLWQRCPTGRPGARESRSPTQASVTLHNLAAAYNWTPSLFGWDGARRQRLNAALDELNERFGRNTVYYSGAFEAVQKGAAPTRIAFHHVPDSLRD